MRPASAGYSLALVLAALLLLGTAGLAMAQAASPAAFLATGTPPGDESYLVSPYLAPLSSPIICRRLTGPLTVDGQASEWAGIERVILDSSTAQYIGGTVSSLADNSAILRCAWDSQYLYLLGDVADDVLIGDSSTIWDDDSLEIALDGDRNRACCDAVDHQLTFSADGRTADFGSVENLTYVRLAVAPRSDSYIIEAAIPFTMFLPISPVSGTLIGFSWGLNDDDDGGRRDARMLWAGATILNYSQFGDILLAGLLATTATPTQPASPPIATPTRTATSTTLPPATATATAPPTATPTLPPAATATPTTAPTATPTVLPTVTVTATPPPTATPTVLPTATPTAVLPTMTATPTITGTPPTATPTVPTQAERLAALDTNLGKLGDIIWQIWGIMQTAGFLPGTPPERGTVTPTATPTALVAGYRQRVNCGGQAYTDTQGLVWTADQSYTSGSWGFIGGLPSTTTVAISSTVDDLLYQSERYNMISYRFDVAPGMYLVELRFAEIYQYAGSNLRVFDVRLEGTTVITGLDLYSLVGPYTAYNVSSEVAVLDGQLNVDFVTKKGAPKVSAIAVIGLGPAGPPPAPSLEQRVINLENYMTELERLFQNILDAFDRFLGL